MHFLVEECPSPAESHLEIPTDGPTAAVCFKTLSDQYLGRINLLRLVSGNFAVDDTLVNVRSSESLRLHQVFRMIGKEQEPVGSLQAGDVFAVAKLDGIRTGDVLTAEGSALDISVPEPPVGHHRVVLHPKTASDDDKLSTALQRLLDEDPSIQTERDEDRGLLICSFLGQSHVDVTIDRMQRLFGVGVTAEPAPVAFRETIQGKAAGVGRHVKQSGGHGQYGIAQIEVAPLERGEGFDFKDEIVGGAIPNSYIPSVEKGVIEAMKKGPIGGFPIVDIEVRLLDGKYHSVDSSDAAFQMAGMLALRDAMANTTAVLLEPILDIDVVVPDDMTGTIMSDLSSRRGRIQGSDALSGGRTAVHAQVPEIEALSIITELRALTSGHAEVAMRYHHHEEVPAQISKRLLEQIKSDDD
jgi:elongation factor G